MSRQILIYGVALALLALLLGGIEFFYFIRRLSMELLILLLALVFTTLGVRAGRRIAARPEFTVTGPTINQRAIAYLGLTTRELEVLRLMAEGCSNQEISDKLHISINTVKSHVSSLLGKLEAERRTQAVHKGRSLGLIDTSGRTN